MSRQATFPPGSYCESADGQRTGRRESRGVRRRPRSASWGIAGGLACRLRQRPLDEPLEVLDEVLAREHEAALRQAAGCGRPLDRLDQRLILVEHLAPELVEGGDLLLGHLVAVEVVG